MKNSSFSNSAQTDVVFHFNDLVHTVFEGKTNALCWERKPEGDFGEIVSKLHLKENITEISAEDLQSLSLSSEGKTARNFILHDLKLLTEYGASPSLNLLQSYERDDEFDFICTDVYSFHVDRSPVATDTFLCTYHGAASEIISNAEAVQKILIKEVRQKLRKLHFGSDETFEAFLKEYYFDLHYEAKPNAQPVNLGNGHLWRLAVDHPQQKVLPCIHRAPIENEGELRLLLIC